MKAKLNSFVFALALLAGVHQAAAQGTAFTYQGRLQNNGSPASGTYNLTFTLFNTNTTGVAIAGPVTTNGVIVTNGLFTVPVDFGSGVFTGANYWLEIGVETNGASPFTTLAPRQQLTPTPYAIDAENANNLPGLVVQQNGLDAPNLIGGSPVNFVPSGVVGATIGGGGATYYSGYPVLSNSVESVFGTVGGGIGNTVTGGNGTVGGGTGNTAGGGDATIAGGDGNTAGGSAAVGGGDFNNASGQRATIGGGENNTASSIEATVSGGYKNTAGNSYATVGGGYTNTASGVGAFIGGGGNDGTIHAGNLVQANAATIGGGLGNNILSGGNYAFIGGGMSNTNAAVDSTIGGGDINVIQANSTYATISGGTGNSINAGSGYSAIGGGGGNLIDINNSAAAIAGGSGNQILAGDANSFIGGGYLNKVFANSVQSTIGGGYNNSNSANYATIGGGYQNAASHTYATVGGGNNNSASGGDATVGGGGGNTASGQTATVSGGAGNTASGSYATVGGGNFNSASGEYSFAAGNQANAKNQGAFVWADSQSGSFSSTANDQVSFRCAGGVTFTGNGTVGTQTVFWTPGNGSWSFVSDRAAKDRFVPVDTGTVLDKVARLPVTEWSYRGYGQRHIGAMAQDFHALFPLNDNDKVLNDADLHGVELAAIKGLNRKLEETRQAVKAKDGEIQTLKQQNDSLAERLNELEATVKQLAAQNNYP